MRGKRKLLHSVCATVCQCVGLWAVAACAAWKSCSSVVVAVGCRACMCMGGRWMPNRHWHGILSESTDCCWLSEGSGGALYK